MEIQFFSSCTLKEKVASSLVLEVKAGFILAQTNAESERNLSISAIIISKKRASLREKTIVGLHSHTEAVSFHNPLNFAVHNIPIIKELKLSVRSAHVVYHVKLK